MGGTGNGPADDAARGSMLAARSSVPVPLSEPTDGGGAARNNAPISVDQPRDSGAWQASVKEDASKNLIRKVLS